MVKIPEKKTRKRRVRHFNHGNDTAGNQNPLRFRKKSADIGNVVEHMG